jgi:large subunit ribosomal protein L28
MCAPAQTTKETTMPKRKINHDTRRQFQPRVRSGQNVSFSQRKSKRVFKPNVQWATIELDGRMVRVKLSAKQIKTLCKTKAE